MPTRLTTEDYWDQVHAARPPAQPSPSKPPGYRLRGLLRRLLGSRARYFRDHTDHVNERICRRILSPDRGTKAIEIGSAPGTRILKLHQFFGYEPFGVEYASSGVEVNRQLFRIHGFNPANVVHSDFFSEDFLEAYRETFDLVCSYGFIEHFEHPIDVVRRHLELLKPSGTLLIQIPNKRGLNFFLGKFFNPKVAEYHNLDIMTLASFRCLFPAESVEPLYCGYVGVFKWAQFNAQPGTLRHRILAVCRASQRFMNPVLHIVFRDRTVQFAATSPYLLFIGRKIG